MNARIAAVGSAFPDHFYDQDTLLEAFRRHWARKHHNPERLERLHRNVLVGGRHLALALEDYEELTGFGDANAAWIRTAQQVGERALRDAFARADIEPAQVDLLMTVTVTGVTTPSLDARLMNRIPFSPHVRRVPIFGLGCVAGAAGIARAAEWVAPRPGSIGVLLSVELCSLTLQREDLSVANMIAGGLFGDGAAAVVLVGEEHGKNGSGPEIVATRSFFYPDTEDVMGWEISEKGFQVVLSAEVPEMVRGNLRRNIEELLADQGLDLGDVRSWVCHPGGPKVLEALQESLDLPEEALAATWRSLRESGQYLVDLGSVGPAGNAR